VIIEYSRRGLYIDGESPISIENCIFRWNKEFGFRTTS
jgi:hypothetical protein